MVVHSNVEYKMVNFTNTIETKVAECEHLTSPILDTVAQIGYFWEEMWIRSPNVQLSGFHSSQLKSKTPTLQQQIRKQKCHEET
jgi:uncharacterized membrane protein